MIFFALRRATRGGIRRCFREMTLCHRKMSYRYTRDSRLHNRASDRVRPFPPPLLVPAHCRMLSNKQTASEKTYCIDKIPEYKNYFE